MRVKLGLYGNGGSIVGRIWGYMTVIKIGAPGTFLKSSTDACKITFNSASFILIANFEVSSPFQTEDLLRCQGKIFMIRTMSS